MRVRYWFGLGFCSLGLAGCGGAKPPAQTATPANSGPLRVESAKPDLSPVVAPKDLVLLARAEHLDKAVATIAHWMNLPFDLKMLDTLGPGLSQTLLADAPVEAAVALADNGDTEVPQPYAVFSAGISSLDAGRKLFEKFGRKLEEVSPGVWLTTDESPVACGLAPALGRAQARVVCGDRRADVESLLPYATRGLPLQAMGTSDVHVEIRMAPIRDKYQQRLRQAKALAIPMALHELGFTDARLSRPITDILYALGDEVLDVVDDLDQIFLDSKLVQNPDRVDVSTGLAFTRAHSWSAQALATAAKSASSAPASLLELPRDSSMASYVTAQNPKSYENLVRRVVALIDGLLAHVNVNAKARDEFARSIDQFNASRTSSAACGAVPGLSDPGASDSKVNILEAFSAWQVCAYDQQPTTAFTAVLDASARILSDPALRKLIDERTLSLHKRAAGAGVPPGTIGYELTVNSTALVEALAKIVSDTPAADKTKEKAKDKKAAAEKPVQGHLEIYVVPDGTRTWLGMGTDNKELMAHLSAAKKATPDNRLGAVQGLAWLRSEPAIAGGFFNLAYVMASVEKRARARGTPPGNKGDALAAAPHHGQTPIPFIWSVKGDSAAPRLECNMRFDRAVFEDVLAVSGQYLMQMAK